MNGASLITVNFAILSQRLKLVLQK